MPEKTKLKKILVIGSGPTAVGHGTELSYASWKAGMLLKQAGYSVIVLESNPSSPALDAEACDRSYIEPIAADTIVRIVEKEKPDAIYPAAGGQKALNLCLEVRHLLASAGVQILGIRGEAIEMVGDRVRFAEAVAQAGGKTLPGMAASSPEEAAAAAEKLGFPIVLRPFFSVAGIGNSVVYNLEELKDCTFRAIKNSPYAKTLAEKAVLGWKEVRCQILRDAAGRTLSTGVIESVDPMGVHSGDSLEVFPAQTLSAEQAETITALAAKLADAAGITGVADVEFAIDPADAGNIVVIEMNPYVTATSRIIATATGFSIEDAATRLALGESLEDVCPQSLTPEVLVVKAPRFSFEKFPAAKRTLDVSMKSIGESIGIGTSFKEALQRALRGPADGHDGLGWDSFDCAADATSLDELRKVIAQPGPYRYFEIKSGLEAGLSAGNIADLTGIDQLFIDEIQGIVQTAAQLRDDLTADLLRQAKSQGFSDAQIAAITGKTAAQIAAARAENGIMTGYSAIGGSIRYASSDKNNTALPNAERRVLMIGPGPNAIGSGSEYELCITRASRAFRKYGWAPIAVNSNVQGPSADPDLWDALFIVPMTDEEVLEVARAVKPDGVSIQFGGPVALKLGQVLEEQGFQILGTSPESHKRCYCRTLRRQLLDDLGMLQPADAEVDTLEEARAAALKIGYPVVLRSLQPVPGKAMEVVYKESDLEKSVREFKRYGSNEKLLVAEFLEDAIEIEMDAVADGESLLIGGVVEHIEEAGIHSGDSACAIPPYTVSESVIREMREQVYEIAAELKVRGLLNVQFAIKNDLIYVTEILPSASLTAPFVCRATDQRLISISAGVTAGVSLKKQGAVRERTPQRMAVRHSVFPFARFPGVDAVLGPEMKSTGRVMGASDSFGLAFAKALTGAGQALPLSGKVFISLKNKDKRPMLFIAKKLEELGFKLIATRGTASALSKNNVKVELISKVSEGRPNIVDLIKNDEVSLIINTPSRKTPSLDEVSIRASAVAHNVPIITTVSGASAAVNAIETVIKRGMELAD